MSNNEYVDSIPTLDRNHFEIEPWFMWCNYIDAKWLGGEGDVIFPLVPPSFNSNSFFSLWQSTKSLLRNENVETD